MPRTPSNRPRSWERRYALSPCAATLAAGLLVAALAAGCGGKSAPPSSPTAAVIATSASEDASTAWIKFAACMTAQGAGKVTALPGAKGGVSIDPGLPRNPTRAQQQAANARVHSADLACHHLIRPFTQSSSGNSGRDEAKFRDGMLAYTRCLRRRGVVIGDPVIKRISGGFDVAFAPIAGQTPASSKTWQDAHAACLKLNPLSKP